MFLEINNTGDSRGYRSAEEQARDLTISLKREVSRVSEQWNSLLQRSDQWQRSLNDSIKVRCSFCILVLRQYFLITK